MPEPGNAPPELQGLLDKVYKTARKQYGDKAKASAVAWAAAKNAGFFKAKDGQWKKKGESPESYWKWHGYWRRVEYQTPYGFDRSVVEALGTVNVAEAMVPFRARILLAVPGKSLNNREYPRETLVQATPLYEGKPFILDHDIEHAERVVGIITRPRYGVEEGYNGQKKEGMWADGLGLMDRDMFDRLAGKGPVPPLIRGVSIGGQGDGQYDVGGSTLIKNFQPAELSVTAFPGIPDAHIAELNMITESYRKQGLLNHGSKMNKTRRQERQEIREGPGQTNTPVMGSNPRPGIRGLDAAVDSIPRQDVTHQVPQQTYGSDAGRRVDPYDQPSGSHQFQSTGADKYAGLKGQSSTEGAPPGSGGTKSSRDARAWNPKIPKTGRTTTQHPGFGNLTPSGTGLADQDEEAYKMRSQAAVASLQNDLDRVLYQLRTGKAPQEAKIDVSKPEEEEEEGEEAKGEEEEGEEEEEHVLMRHLARLQNRKLQREIDYDLGDQRSPSKGPDGDTTMSNYQRTINPGVDATHNPPNEAGFDPSVYKAGSRPSAFAPQEDFAKANPIKSEGEEEEEEEERVIRNRIIALRMKRLFPGLEAAPGGERPYTQAPIPKTPKLGYSTTKTPGFGKQSPSGTGMTDQPEEEEETITINGVRYRREQTPASDVDKTRDMPSGEEEEEEAMPRTPTSMLQPGDGKSPAGNPLMKTQHNPTGDNVGANPVTAGGEEEEHRRLESIPQDLIPIEGHAPSVAFGMGQTLWHRIIKKTNEPSAEQLKQMIETFNMLKQPKPEQYKRVIVKTNESRNSLQPIGSGKQSMIPSMLLPGVPAKGAMSTGATMPSQPYQTVSQDMRAVREMAAKKLKEIEALPMTARKSTNLGKSLWEAILPEIMEVQR